MREEMRKAEVWNLISGGPSRRSVTQDQLLDGPTVTVNRAIDVTAQNVNVHFAAFADGPKVWMVYDLLQFWRPGIVLWLTQRPTMRNAKIGEQTVQVPGESFSSLWHKVLPMSIGFRYMPFGAVTDVVDGKTQRAAFTALCALQGILQFKPKAIRIFGMDMEGSWVDGKTVEECKASDAARSEGLKTLDRWVHERGSVQRVIEEAKKTGIEIEVV